MVRTRHTIAMIVLVSGLLLTSCVSIGLGNCTDIGCQEAITVNLEGIEVGESVTIRVEADGEHMEAVCEGTTVVDSGWSYDMDVERIDCGTSSVTFNFNQNGEHPIDLSTVEVTVTQAGQQMTQTFEPEFTITRPNGRWCPPECRSTEVTLQMP